MSNTLKFGAGKWAAKAGSVLAYNDENDNFKPLPFTFTRASTATRVNESGLIESVASGVPRIDFLDNADGHLLLEPSRTNILPYSEAFDNAAWTKSNTSITANSVISPDGNTTADKLISSASEAVHYVGETVGGASTGVNYTFSVFAKAAEESVLAYRDGTYETSSLFNLLNGTVVSGANHTSSIIDYGNGWYRCITTSINVFPNIDVRISPREYASYTGDGTSGVYIFGAQVEAGSYATSYIPTSGSSVTRAAEVASQTVPSGVIGQTEGTIFVDFQFNQTPSDINGRVVGLWSTNDTTNSIIALINQSNQLQVSFFGSGSGAAVIPAEASTLLELGQNKLAIAYTSTSATVYINGVLFGTGNPTGYYPASLTSIGIGSSTTSVRSLGNPIKQTLLYNTRLSNSELAALTS